MPTFFNITLTFECANCDYSNTTRDEKRAKLLKRLHMKKCSQVGRTIPKRTPQDIIDARDKRNGLHVGNSHKKHARRIGKNLDTDFEDVPDSSHTHHTQVGEKDGINYHEVGAKDKIGKPRTLTPKQKKKMGEWRQVKDKKQRGGRGGRTHTQEVCVMDRDEQPPPRVQPQRRMTMSQVKSLSMKTGAKDTRAQYASLL